MKKILFGIIIILIIFPVIVAANDSMEDFNEQPFEEVFAKGKVLNLQDIVITDRQSQYYGQEIQEVTVKIYHGPGKGTLIKAWNMKSGRPGWDIDPQIKDKIVLAVDQGQYYVADYAREDKIFWIIGLFIILIIALGGMKGIKAIGSLALTIMLIFIVLMPAALHGFPLIPLTILICAVVSTITFFIIGGITKKSVSALIGTTLGCICAGIIAIIAGKTLHLTGLASDESLMLWYATQNAINFQGLLFSGMMIGALGAIMDVAISVSSSMIEVRKAHPEIGTKKLIKSGLNVGKDIMGTMSNTLILAYTGGALPLLLLFMANQIPMIKILNLDMIATEVIRAMAGSIGIILSVPLTALIGGWLITSEIDFMKE
ncbi:YibE/F family protein [Candidatus Margulisiibacteriota bacterium]